MFFIFYIYSGFNIDVFARELVVLECIVAGTSFRAFDTIEHELIAVKTLDLKREPTNEHDKFAVGVYLKDIKLGYLPKNKNETIARLMDEGKSFYVNLERMSWEGNWLKLEIKVVMKG